MPISITRFQIIANRRERHSTAWIAPCAQRTQIKCMHCGNTLMSGYNYVYEVIMGESTEYGYHAGYSEVSFPITIRCSNKNCATWWHFHKI